MSRLKLALLLVVSLSFPAGADAANAGSGVLAVAVTAAPNASSALPSLKDLRDGLKRLFDAQLGSILTLAVQDAASSARPGPAARVGIDLAGGLLVVSTDFSPTGDFGGAVRSLVSRVPTGSPASLLATMSGDLAFLFFSWRGFSTLALAPPPLLAGVLSTDTLGMLTGWNPQEMEPLGIASRGEEITLCFPHRYLTLGPRFQITQDTARDINAQAGAPEPRRFPAWLPDRADGSSCCPSSRAGWSRSIRGWGPGRSFPRPDCRLFRRGSSAPEK